ncbi:MAG: class I SAM-dependent methyltransferase [Bacteroidales bacterium]
MQSTEDISTLEAFVQNLFEKDGPDPEDYNTILDMVDKLPTDHIQVFREHMQPILHSGTIIGFSYTKPFGYNGDFFIIEKIYQQYVSPDTRYRKWDLFFHQLPAAIAVVNRKQMAINSLMALNDKANEKPKKVLILGSGPMTEVYEYLQEVPENKLLFDLIDLDQRAIDYARQKNKDYLDFMRFFNKNVIRFSPDQQYDLIWSAGLFDYFKDKHFVFLLKRYYDFIAPGGKMIIGNFNVENPSRKIMEMLGDWFLYHRSEEELMMFAQRSGIPESCVRVSKEPLGINLFLEVAKDGQ